MVSAIDYAKRSLVALLKALAKTYAVVLTLSRESSDAVIRTAVRKLSLKVHPDRGGSEEDQKLLNTSKDAWQEAIEQARGKRGAPHDWRQALRVWVGRKSLHQKCLHVFSGPYYLGGCCASCRRLCLHGWPAMRIVVADLGLRFLCWRAGLELFMAPPWAGRGVCGVVPGG
jgi:hypothetical protein